MADAVMIGQGLAKMPDSWIDLLSDDPAERTKWKQNELRKEL